MYLHTMYIQDIMREWKADAKIKGFITWKYDRKDKVLNIYTHRPGPMIGMMGERIARFTDKLRAYEPDIKINLEETEGIV